MSSLREHPDVAPYVVRDVTLTGQRMTSGTYCNVEEATMYGGTLCAARISTITSEDSGQVSEIRLRNAEARFIEMCRTVSCLRHPHVAQFFGVGFLSGAHLPVIVTERPVGTLHDLIEATPRSQTIPIAVKCSLLGGLGRGLAFLHHRSPPVVHGALTARDVFLDSAGTPKIANVGEAARAESSFGATPFSPEVAIYIPPEAMNPTQEEGSNFDPSRDIFSLGVLAIFTLGQISPSNLLGPTYTDETGSLVSRSELEKRAKYLRPIISSLTKEHPLIELIQRSLCDNSSQRPPIEELQGLISKAMEMCEGDDRVCGSTRLQSLQTLSFLQRDQSQENLRRQVQLVQEKLALEEELLRKKAEIEAALENLKRLREGDPLDENERERAATEAVATPQPPETQQSPPRERPPLREQRRDEVVAQEGPLPTPENLLRIQCYHQKPVKLEPLLRGSSTIDGNFAYLTPQNTSIVFRYNTINGEGMEFPNSLYHNSSVVSMDGRMVLIGGSSEGCVTNKLLTLDYTGQWIEDYPPMNTERSHCAALCVTNECFRTHLLVIGGKCNDGQYTKDVEFLNTVTKSWYTLSPLPQALTLPSALVCGNTLYVVGSNGPGYSCSIDNLMSYNNDDTQPPTSQITWTPLPTLPVKESSVATIRGELVSFGGYSGTLECRAILQLVGQDWVEIGCTLLPRRRSLTVCASRDKVIILGGEGAGKSVELCNAE